MWFWKYDFECFKEEFYDIDKMFKVVIYDCDGVLGVGSLFVVIIYVINNVNERDGEIILVDIMENVFG